eukprot:09657_1
MPSEKNHLFQSKVSRFFSKPLVVTKAWKSCELTRRDLKVATYSLTKPSNASSPTRRIAYKRLNPFSGTEEKASSGSMP